MDFITALRKGKNAIKITLPAAWGEDDFESYDGILITDDKDREWTIGNSYGTTYLSQDTLDKLIERTSIIAKKNVVSYADEYQRTYPSDPNWSPLIEAKIITLSDGKSQAFYIERWVSYSDEEKIAIAELIIPTENSDFTFTCEADSSDIDHPLEAVRDAMYWLLHQSDLQVLLPCRYPSPTVILAQQASTLTIPCLYQQVIDDDKTKACFLFKTITLAYYEGVQNTGKIMVWKSPDKKIEGANIQKDLDRYARQTTLQMITEGLLPENIVKIETTPKTLANGLKGIELSVGSVDTRDYYDAYLIQQWFVDDDGAVFYIAVSALDGIPVHQMRETLERVVQSWQRSKDLARTEKPQPQQALPTDSPKKKWWQVWK